MMRPYVVGFLAFFLAAGIRDLGRTRALGFLLWGFLVALVAELSSTRAGLPFGLYHYTGDTAGTELFLGNVPFFSPAYASSASPGGRSGRAGPEAARVGSAWWPCRACSWPCSTS